MRDEHETEVTNESASSTTNAEQTSQETSAEISQMEDGSSQTDQETQPQPDRSDEDTDSQETQGNTSSRITVSASDFTDLTGFQRDILVIIAGMDTPKGLAIKEELEQYYDDEIHHGRLYPNLDTLVEKALVEKFAINERTNGYELSELGHAHLRHRREWEQRQVADIQEQTPSSDPDQRESADASPVDSSNNVEEPDEAKSEARETDQNLDSSTAAETGRDQPEEEDLLDEIEREFEDLSQEQEDPDRE